MTIAAVVVVCGGEVVVGASVVEVVGGSKIDVVGGSKIDVVGGSATVVVGDGRGAVVPGDVVPVDLGAVVATTGWVVGVVSEGTVVEGSMVEEDVDVELDVVVGAGVVVVTRAVVLGDRLATCWRGELSVPVATSNKRPAMATAAMA